MGPIKRLYPATKNGGQADPAKGGVNSRIVGEGMAGRRRSLNVGQNESCGSKFRQYISQHSPPQPFDSARRKTRASLRAVSERPS